MEESKKVINKEGMKQVHGGIQVGYNEYLWCPECCEENDITILDKTPIGYDNAGDRVYRYHIRCNKCGAETTW